MRLADYHNKVMDYTLDKLMIEAELLEAKAAMIDYDVYLFEDLVVHVKSLNNRTDLTKLYEAIKDLKEKRNTLDIKINLVKWCIQRLENESR
jgi:hypothetical protein